MIDVRKTVRTNKNGKESYKCDRCGKWTRYGSDTFGISVDFALDDMIQGNRNVALCAKCCEDICGIAWWINKAIDMITDKDGGICKVSIDT